MPKSKRQSGQGNHYEHPISGTGGTAPPATSRAREFTVEEHLSVQREIELRAYRFWQAHGSAAGGTLDHWVRAENVVLEEFVGGRLAANETRPQTGKRSFPTAIPLHRPRPPSRPAVILPH